MYALKFAVTIVHLAIWLALAWLVAFYSGADGVVKSAQGTLSALSC